MKVLLLTPYSPLHDHDHAAADIAEPMVEALAGATDLHVIAADSTAHGRLSVGGAHAQFHAAPATTGLSPLRRFAPYPYRLRLTWSHAHTQHVRAIAEAIHPDVIHVEYLQPAEAILRATPALRSATWHDITHRVVQAEALHEPGRVRRTYLRWESSLIRHLERHLAAAADRNFVFSERDRREVHMLGGQATAVNMGVVPPSRRWDPQTRDLVFVGALWRRPNVLTARYLVEQVMPLVWREEPAAGLRIVGARPTADVVRLAEVDRVHLHADVPDLDPYIAGARVNLAPSLVEAGILLKALLAMGMGAPVLLNRESAEPISGLVAGVHAAVADSPEDIAAEVVSLIRDHDRAQTMGAAGQALVRDNYSWRGYAESLVQSWETAIEARRLPKVGS